MEAATGIISPRVDDEVALENKVLPCRRRHRPTSPKLVKYLWAGITYEAYPGTLICPYCGESADPHDNPSCPLGDLSPRPLPVEGPGCTLIPYVPTLNIKENAVNNSIMLRKLPLNFSDADLRQVCTTFGPLTKVHAVIDDETDLCLGEGYASFESIDDAETAIQGLKQNYGYDVRWFVH